MIANILLVDDEPEVLRSLARLLGARGHKVTTAATAEEAVKRLRIGPIDVIVSDVRLPDDAELAFLDEIKTLEEPPEIIVITGDSCVETAIRALRMGVVDYLIKPFELEDLTAAVLAAVERRLASSNVRRARQHAQAWLSSLESAQRLLAVSGMTTSARVPAPAEDPRLLDLSTRERQIVAALVRGLRTPQISAELNISAHTVRNHLKSVFRKLGVHSQIALVAMLGEPPNQQMPTVAEALR